MTRAEREAPAQAVEAVMQVIIDLDEIRKLKIVQRNDPLNLALRRLRRRAEQANTKVCEAWFRGETGGNGPTGGAATGKIVPFLADAA